MLLKYSTAMPSVIRNDDQNMHNKILFIVILYSEKYVKAFEVKSFSIDV